MVISQPCSRHWTYRLDKRPLFPVPVSPYALNIKSNSTQSPALTCLNLVIELLSVSSHQRPKQESPRLIFGKQIPLLHNSNSALPFNLHLTPPSSQQSSHHTFLPPNTSLVPTTITPRISAQRTTPWVAPEDFTAVTGLSKTYFMKRPLMPLNLVFMPGPKEDTVTEEYRPKIKRPNSVFHDVSATHYNSSLTKLTRILLS
ncbi:hypothetical protein Glove_157g32 [Diversispora epigaea]|uniref:Uncharacterized protein n=1 Tax=Diversispora epigaea TaxID=1348612 RepID=A0A397IY68_9GLOM|nr:hypothetical protein Glove_157g32 [Diversispora epigaea]